jgi:glycine betaine/proline transport system ATP-binding protein
LRAVNGLNPSRAAPQVHDGDSGPAKSGPLNRELRKLRRECVSMVFQAFGSLPWRTSKTTSGWV